jgi:hypothetical protein
MARRARESPGTGPDLARCGASPKSHGAVIARRAGANGAGSLGAFALVLAIDMSSGLDVRTAIERALRLDDEPATTPRGWGYA